jgi:outer membrane protein assembly factor BamB
MKSVLMISMFCLLLATAGCSDKPPATEPFNPPHTPQQGRTPTPGLPAGDNQAFWPRFHGPKDDNISPDKGLLQQWPEGGPKLLWTAPGLGEGFSGVSINDGLIYTAGVVENQALVFAIDMMKGNIVWKTPNGPAWSGQYPGSRGTPTYDSGRLYHESAAGDVICLDAKSGTKIWAKNTLSEFEAPNIRWALAESLLIDGNRLICCPGGPKASVAALDKKTGNVVWAAKSTGDQAGYASPCLIECQKLRMVLTMNQRALIGVNAGDGDLLFRYEHKTEYDVNATTPAYRDGQIFITSGYGSGSEMLKLKVDGSKASVEKLWDAKLLDDHHGGLVVLDGFIYGCSFRGNWICLDWATGNVTYNQKLVGKGSLTYADGMLYILSENGQVGLVSAQSKDPKVISQFKLPSGGEGKSWAHPVVCGGRLYIRHGNVLFAFDVRGDRS